MKNPKTTGESGEAKMWNTFIGRNAVLRQNVTIGANSCAIEDITIGNNVTIEAMSLINKNVPDNHTAYNSRDMIVIQNAA